MRSETIKSNLLLLLAAIIWGFSFVAQRAGMEHVGPFTFNGVRFALGTLSLLPLLFFGRESSSTKVPGMASKNQLLIISLLAGIVLFIAISFQQIGMVYTTAGKGGFITGLYVILVPVFGIFIGQKTSLNIWFGGILGLVGLYFLSITDNLNLEFGDLLVLISAFFFAAHILIIGRYSGKVNAIKLSILQFTVCSILSLAVAILYEEIILEDILEAGLPIIYGGVFSVGIAYTLQVFGQKKAHPSSASIILSMESLFAVLGGWLFLSEQMTQRGFFGCGLMLTGMVLAQIKWSKKQGALNG